MRFETEIQILPADLPLRATARLPWSADLQLPVEFSDGILPITPEGDPNGPMPLVPFRRVNYTTLIFFANAAKYRHLTDISKYGVMTADGEIVMQRVTVLDVSTLTDALGRLNGDTVMRALDFGIPRPDPDAYPDRCGWFGWDFQPTAVRAVIHIQEG